MTADLKEATRVCEHGYVASNCMKCVHPDRQKFWFTKHGIAKCDHEIDAPGNYCKACDEDPNLFTEDELREWEKAAGLPEGVLDK